MAVVIFLTAGTTSWVVPSYWDNANNTIETIGGGGGGQTNTSSGAHNVGGGGGAYSKISNLTLTPSDSITVSIGTGGGAGVDGGDTYFNGASLGASSVGAKGGTNGASGGAGGVGASGVGTVKNSGGSGGANTGSSTFGGGTGGGGGGGPNGDGKNGGTVSGIDHGGSGGGAGSGGTDGAVGGFAVGGNGGTGFDSTAGGTGGSGNIPGGNGSHGSGGGGGALDSGLSVGGNGGAGIEFDGTHGAGGGGGGGGDDANGGAGGLYGGGGGSNGAGAGAGGSGANGLIVITLPLVDDTYAAQLIPFIRKQRRTRRDFSFAPNVDLTLQEIPLSIPTPYHIRHRPPPTTIKRQRSVDIYFNVDLLNQNLSPLYYTNTNTFYSPIVTLFATPAVYVNTNVFYAPTVISSIANLSLNANVEITSYVHLVATPLATASLDPFHDPVWVAVEIDVFDDVTPITIRMGNRGVIKRTVLGTLYQYDPRLQQIPIELGTTITVISYGSPVRGQPNGGIISFTVDESIWTWFAYRWIGQRFRVYTGKSTNPVEADVDDDMTLIYVGRVASIKHDTIVATIQTTDETIQWDNPLVTDYYGSSFAKVLREKPKPFLWGYAFNLEPQIRNEATQTYDVSYRPGGLDFISEVRVGGIPWNYVTGTPVQGEWAINSSFGFQLGSPPLGMDVRCDAQQGRFTVAGIIRSIIEGVGGEVDDNYMGILNNKMPGKVSYATTTTPINLLDAIDDFVTAHGCWWAVGPLGKVIAGVIDVPALNASYLLDDTNISSISLNTIHPPAWRIRVGYQRNWSPQTTFATSVLQVEQKKWSEPGQIYSPKYENNSIKTVEPRAVDVPLLNGTLVNSNDARPIQQRLVTAWGTVRSLFDVSVFVRSEDIFLYDTVAVNYMFVTGNFRITGAIRAIGTGPCTLQLWGTIGAFAVEPPISTLPQGVDDVGIWTRNSGSGTFEVGVDCPSTVTRLWVRGVGSGGGGAGGFTSGSLIYGGGGGGSGGYFEDVITVTASSTIDWIVGSGGLGSAGIAVADSGTDTTFGACTGSGGAGGSATVLSTSGGAGGGASGATVALFGGVGGNGYVREISLNFEEFTANGASSPFGGGGHAATQFETGGASGTGGGGHVNNVAMSESQNEAESGGDGNDGLIIVIWFAP